MTDEARVVRFAEGVDVGSPSAVESNAIHDDVASEISAIAEKTEVVDDDIILIEDSADSNNKKRVKVSNLPGGVGGFNYCDNPSGKYNIDGWTESDDDDWDVSRNTTTPIGDGYDIKMTKAASDETGEYIAYDFDLETRHLSSTLKISFDCDASDANYADNDVAIKLYDLDNSVYIEPVGFELKAGNGKFVCSVQTDASSTNYELRFVINSTNAAAYSIYIYNVQIGPYEPSYGTPITPLVSYVPSCSWSSNVTVTGQWYRSGEFMHGEVLIDCSGAPTSTTLYISIPSGFTIDTSKVLQLIQNETSLGYGYVKDGVTTVYTKITPMYYDSNSFLIRHHGVNDAINQQIRITGSVNQSSPMTFASGDSVHIFYKIPITGWGVQAQMSDVDSGGIVAARYTTATAGSYNSGDILDFETKDYDTRSLVTTGSVWKFTALESGYYNVRARILWASHAWVAGELCYLQIYKDGVQYAEIGRRNVEANITTNLDVRGNGAIYLEAGEYFDIRVGGNISSQALETSVLHNHISIEKVQGPSAILATETIGARYSTNAGQTITNGSTDIVNYEDVDNYDSHGIVTVGASWKAESPISAEYSIKVLNYVIIATGEWDEGESLALRLYINGALWTILDWVEAVASPTSQVIKSLKGSTDIPLNKGDYFDIRITNSTGASVTLGADGNLNHISISRLK